MKEATILSLAAALAVSLNATEVTIDAAELDAMKAQIETLTDKLDALEKQQKKSDRSAKKLSNKVSEIKAATAFDNVKFSVDFRNGYDNLHYRYNEYSYRDSTGTLHDLSGTTAQNPSLLTSRLYLGMKAAPSEHLTFFGQFGMYGTWGGNNLSGDASVKDWSETSKATDTVFRLRQAYFVWADRFGQDGMPYSFSIGRRPATDGFLANHREGDDKPGSPLAHITNMEVDAAMVKLDINHYLPLDGSYLKLVYGRAHNGVAQVYDSYGFAPYAYDTLYTSSTDAEEDSNVNFLVTILNAYDDGQYHLMAQHAMIMNTKGISDTGVKKVGAGTAHLGALSLQVDGIGSEISDFLDNTTLFASAAMTYYDPDNGYKIFGKSDSSSGYSAWAGIIIPDMMTERGNIGFEYNHGSKYWTPMTWAEDTAIGSKIAIRGDAYEAYWNFHLFGSDYLTGQLRYTYAQHNYTPNIRCEGWVTPVDVDIVAEDLRFFIRYTF